MSTFGLSAARELSSEKTELVIGEQWYNHADAHPTTDPDVRMALTQALNLGELQKVITSNTGAAATGIAILAPAACTGDSVKGNVPATDTSAAASTRPKLRGRPALVPGSDPAGLTP